MKKLHLFVGVLGMVMAVPMAFADTFTLVKDGKFGGGTVEGRELKREGGRIVIETGIGTVTLSETEVLSVAKGRTALDEYDERYAGIKDGKNADDIYALAVWAKGKGVHKHVFPLMKKAVELNSEHEGARKALGFEKYQGKWMSKDQIMEAKGFVKYQGKWITPAEKELAVGEEREARLKAQIAAEENRRRKEEALRMQQMPREDLMRDDLMRRQYVNPTYNPYYGSYYDNPWSYYSRLGGYTGYPYYYFQQQRLINWANPYGSLYYSSPGVSYLYDPLLTTTPLPLQYYGYPLGTIQPILPGSKSISGGN